MTTTTLVAAIAEGMPNLSPDHVQLLADLLDAIGTRRVSQADLATALQAGTPTAVVAAVRQLVQSGQAARTGENIQT